MLRHRRERGVRRSRATSEDFRKAVDGGGGEGEFCNQIRRIRKQQAPNFLGIGQVGRRLYPPFRSGLCGSSEPLQQAQRPFGEFA